MCNNINTEKHIPGIEGFNGLPEKKKQNVEEQNLQFAQLFMSKVRVCLKFRLPWSSEKERGEYTFVFYFILHCFFTLYLFI